MIMQKFYGVFLGNNVKNNPKEYLNLPDNDDIDLDYFLDKNLEIIECRNKDSVSHYLVVKESVATYSHSDFIDIINHMYNDNYDSVIMDFVNKFGLISNGHGSWLVVVDYIN